MRLLLMLSLVLGAASCRSSRDKPEREPEIAVLMDERPDAQVGGYYKLKGGVTRFYRNVPKFTELLPDKYLGHGHVVQLLAPNAMDGWARVKNEDLDIGYVRFTSLKIVPPHKQPKPKVYEPDYELDRRMRER